MQFPYAWQCQYSNKLQGPFFTCNCTLYPLYLIFQFHSEKKVLNITSTKFNAQSFSKFKNNKVITLQKGKQFYFFRLFSDSDYNLVQKLFYSLFPQGEFLQNYQTQTPQISLSSHDNQLMLTESIKSKQKYLVRSLSLSKKSSLQELNIMRKMNSRVIMQPIQIYTHNHILKLVYQYRVGNNLKKLMKIRKVFDEEEICSFIKSLLIFAVYLENKNIMILEIKQQYILVQGTTIYSPFFFNLSTFQIIQNPQQISKKYINIVYLIAKLMFKISTSQEYFQFEQANKVLFKLALNNRYSKHMINLLKTMLKANQKQYSANQALRHIWFKEIKMQGSKNLSTILSLYQGQESTNLNLNSLTRIEEEQGVDFEKSLHMYMMRLNENLRLPFYFNKK